MGGWGGIVWLKHFLSLQCTVAILKYNGRATIYSPSMISRKPRKHQVSAINKMLIEIIILSFKDLISVLESELSLGYQEAATALLYRPEVYDAKSLHQAIEDHENDTLIEIICSRKEVAIESIREAYEEG